MFAYLLPGEVVSFLVCCKLPMKKRLEGDADLFRGLNGMMVGELGDILEMTKERTTRTASRAHIPIEPLCMLT